MSSRAEFSRKTKNEALERAGHKCGNCRIDLSPKTGIEYDHRIPDAVGGANSVANCVPLCKNCHGSKTKVDVSEIAHTKRAHDKHFNTKTKSQRGFRGWRKFDGTIVYRRGT